MKKRFENRVVAITGAASGLGQTCALRFASEGAELILLDINVEGLKHTAAQIRALGSQCTSIAIDLADEGAIAELGDALLEQFSKIDVLYNNAGLAYGEINKMLDAVDQASWLRFLSINTLAPLFLAKALRPALANAKGVVLNQSSMAAYAPASVYGVTKSALNQVTYGMAHLFAEDNIRVNAIAPGIMETQASKDSLDKATYERVQGMQLSTLHGTADDIASLALFLASEEGRFINCEVVHCDAGNRLRGWRE
ncbi:SDR family NAD(P)-dependent oxidoreductase [Litorivivens sp.]|uniref:SDR family NAD(P)-dependent oxidoreductase n=1 Tax=Litorivivens sp. TaxID=2020868 RepID=UPI003561A29C